MTRLRMHWKHPKYIQVLSCSRSHLGWPTSTAPVIANEVDMMAAITTSMRTLSIRFLNVLSEMVLSGVMISAFARSRRITAKRMAELRLAKASPIIVRSTMARRYPNSVFGRHCGAQGHLGKSCLSNCFDAFVRNLLMERRTQQSNDR